MNTIFEDLAAPPRMNLDYDRTGLAFLENGETKSPVRNHRPLDEGRNIWPQETTLLKWLYELVIGMPAMAEVQALRVWLHQPEDRPIRLQLLMDDLSAKPHQALDLPLDDSIADWVWQHQRPLIITTEGEARFPDFTRRLLECGIKYFCAVPLILANRRIGVLGLVSTTREALGSLDLDFVRRGVLNIAGANKKNGATLYTSQMDACSGHGAFNLEDEVSPADNFEGIIGRSAGIAALRKQIKVVAPTNSTALILGETGTGKELIARAIHNLSPRSDGPFIKVNCAAIPAGLIESELFGHERGAFTGAVTRRTGRFEMANGGTIFLDEIGDIPLELQPKLLRVLQEQEFERVGSTQTTRVNVRIVAATSRDLPGMVADREFRADLYYRLNVFPIAVPALRERSEDIPLLVRHFVGLYSGRANKRVSEVPAETMETLSQYQWPGNVRELQNIIERAVILSPGKVLRAALDELQPAPQTGSAVRADNGDHRATLKDLEREHIIQALAATNWVIGGPKGAAARLGLLRTTMIAKMQKLGITRAQA